MTEIMFAALILMATNGGSMVKVSEFLSMEDCEHAARGVRFFHAGREAGGNLAIAICVPSFVGDKKPE